MLEGDEFSIISAENEGNYVTVWVIIVVCCKNKKVRQCICKVTLRHVWVLTLLNFFRWSYHLVCWDNSFCCSLQLCVCVCVCVYSIILLLHWRTNLNFFFTPGWKRAYFHNLAMLNPSLKMKIHYKLTFLWNFSSCFLGIFNDFSYILLESTIV
jgi:hypothetical protein